MDWFPPEPDVAPSERATGQTALRYEDVSQDGRVMLLGLPHAIGDIIWKQLIVYHGINRAAHAGIIPVLTRFVLEGGQGPISVRWPLSGAGAYQLAHTVGADGTVDRLLLNMWVNLQAPRGRTNGPPPPGAGEPIPVGRVFAEHVMTRLFAPPEARKVLRLEDPELPSVPPARWSWRPWQAVLALPEGARSLDGAPRTDEAEVVFGLHHTDSNQHVNSLVYPRLFQDAALRRLAAHGRSTVLLPRRLEVAYRKPLFAGQRAHLWLQAFADAEGLGAVGAFVSERAPLERPHAVLQIRFAD
jgi:hypothetical protein